ncbi:hypothetical protein P3X46_029535 [Hevea brasiliensis]|uniref:T-complex protein 1 subunit gamma n=1 Tax=Hevea brasiliensis TaxID=3981 RepID=A0ABQ9KSI5_HEVBR|nr:hypothetical protein P3X46_029535 [Hevea brasiliensis]
MHAPVLVLRDSLKRESGNKVRHSNIQASKAVANIICTSWGPRSMLKMLLDAGIVVTNDGNAILRELDLAHPAAKSMIELSCTQDEEVGDGTRDGTTSVIVLGGLAIDATSTVGVDLGQGLREVDIKKYINVEKVPGEQLEDSKVLKGVIFNKDVVAPGKMRRKIVNPRIILLDCPLEYKKVENQTNAELVRKEDWGVLLKMEEEYIESMCMQILKFKPDLVITEKGLSDLACHYLSTAGVGAIRRLRKTDNNRIAKACGAVIVNRLDELQESDVVTGAGLFEVKKIGD